MRTPYCVVRVCVRACVRACMHVCGCACACVCACLREKEHMCHKMDFLLVIVLNICIGKTAE